MKSVSNAWNRADRALTKATAVLTDVSRKCKNTKFTITGYSQVPTPRSQRDAIVEPNSDAGDLYWSIRKGDSPLLGSLGSILSKTPSANGDTRNAGDNGNAQLATALTSDLSGADLPALGEGVAALSPHLDRQTFSRGELRQIASLPTAIWTNPSPQRKLPYDAICG